MSFSPPHDRCRATKHTEVSPCEPPGMKPGKSSSAATRVDLQSGLWVLAYDLFSSTEDNKVRLPDSGRGAGKPKSKVPRRGKRNVLRNPRVAMPLIPLAGA